MSDQDQAGSEDRAAGRDLRRPEVRGHRPVQPQRGDLHQGARGQAARGGRARLRARRLHPDRRAEVPLHLPRLRHRVRVPRGLGQVQAVGHRRGQRRRGRLPRLLDGQPPRRGRHRDAQHPHRDPAPPHDRPAAGGVQLLRLQPQARRQDHDVGPLRRVRDQRHRSRDDLRRRGRGHGAAAQPDLPPVPHAQVGPQGLVLVRRALSKREIFYEEEFRQIERNFDNFSFHIALSDAMPEDELGPGLRASSTTSSSRTT